MRYQEGLGVSRRVAAGVPLGCVESATVLASGGQVTSDRRRARGRG
jgi:hypothetical protein